MLVEATALGLFQHPWAPIHPMQLEEAPSLQLGWRMQSQFTPATSQLGSCTSGRAVRPAVDIPQVFGTSESEGRGRFLGPGVAGNLSKGTEERAGDLDRPHLRSHQASATGRVQDQGGLGWA